MYLIANNLDSSETFNIAKELSKIGYKKDKIRKNMEW
tara:strand:- start:3665 stop:3775 length:111 start_codon:yes stop_codon:yes gene_type:complete